MSFLERIRNFVFLGSILSTVCVTIGQQCFDDGNEICIDENDILSVDLLPGSFLFPDQQIAKNTSTVLDNKVVDGSINDALNNMEFHRKRMNEYLCHGYMAMEIVKLMSTPRVKRRLGTSENNELRDLVDVDNVTVHDKLLADEGSLKYKNWLQRRTTLDDVYRHYIPRKKMGKVHGSRDDNIEDFDGEVTGYAMQAPLPSGKVGFYEGNDGDDDHMISSSSGHNIYYGHSYGHGGDPYSHHSEVFPAIHEEHYYPPIQYNEHHEHEEEYHKPYYYKGKGSELSIQDFFEIALTALAFLAFGLFVIQLLMNMTNTMTTTMATVVTTARRSKRNIAGLPFFYNSNEELNELAYNVLRSIEGALVADLDSGNCLRRILCEGNKHSTQTADARKIWAPVWSLGMSWLSGRVTKGSPWTSMMDSLKASILGLGKADCSVLYPDCNLKKERIKRLRKRRR
ncbi:uncharacterized protein LOC117222869 isoform X1 [Megalopta genalis]|uniref:uncharacterized protein LOC117222869 isoform X1 n=1 Tax=Megalopta genalis TaxID=115081 RepID=UPI0014430919|nr:uncharacterized protein LOC117222869 [Megalopta genalis]